jgi:hypothetical protein
MEWVTAFYWISAGLILAAATKAWTNRIKRLNELRRAHILRSDPSSPQDRDDDYMSILTTNGEIIRHQGRTVKVEGLNRY